MAISTPGSHEFVRGARGAPDESYVEGEVDTDVEDGDTTMNTTMNTSTSRSVLDESSFVDNSFLNTINDKNPNYVGTKGVQKLVTKKVTKLSELENLGPSSDSESVTSESESEAEAGGGLRRSRRATKGRRFAFWKGERPLYEQGTLVGLLQADPTPAKKTAKRGREDKRDNKRKYKTSSTDHDRDSYSDELPPLPPSKLPKDLKYIPRTDVDRLAVWDEVLETSYEMKVVVKAESLLPASALPRTAQRPPGKDKVGYAAHSFNVPEIPGVMSGWISGFVDLPPEAIKDAEGVGKYAQVFFVASCQEDAVELGIADPSVDTWTSQNAQRVILRKGDSFFIPPGNIYRLENHSTEASCMLYWTIIKPVEIQGGGGTASSEGNMARKEIEA